MADAVKSLDIEIRTRQELEGAQAAADSIDRQIGKCKALGEDYTLLEQKLINLNAAINLARERLDAKTAELERTSEAARRLSEENAALAQSVKNIDLRNAYVAEQAPKDLAEAAARTRELELRKSRLADATATFTALLQKEEAVAGQSAMEQVQSLETVNQASDTAETHTKNLGNAHKELHRLMHLVAEQSPVMALVLRTAMSPVGGTLMAAVVAFQKLAQAEEEAKKSAEDLAALASRPFGNMRQAIYEATLELDNQKRSFSEWAKQVSSDTDSITKELDVQIEKLKQRTTAIKDVAKAEMEANLARIDANPNLGPQEKENQKSELKRSYEMAIGETDLSSIKSELTEITKALLTASVRLGVAREDVRDADAVATNQHRSARLKAISDEISNAESAAQDYDQKTLDADKKLSAAIQKANENRQLRSSVGIYGGEGEEHDKKRIDEAEREVDRFTKLRDGEKVLAQAARDERRKYLDDQAKADAALEDAKRRVSEYTNATKELSKRQSELKERAQSETETQTKVNRFKEFEQWTRTPFGGMVSTDVSEAVGTAKALEENRQVSEESKQKLVDVAAAIAGHQVSLQQAVEMMDWAAKDMGNFVTDVVRLATSMQGLATGHSALTGKVLSIEAQVAQILSRLNINDTVQRL